MYRSHRVLINHKEKLEEGQSNNRTASESVSDSVSERVS
jgi:hypothetical protein